MTGVVAQPLAQPDATSALSPQDIRLSYLKRRLALENAIAQEPARAKDLLTSYLEDIDHRETSLASNGHGSAILNAVEKSEIDKNRRLAQARQGSLPKIHKNAPTATPTTEVPWYDNTAILPEIVIKSGRLLAGNDDQLKAHKAALIDTPLKEARQILAQREAAGSENTDHLKTFIRQMSPLAEKAGKRLAPVSVTEISHDETLAHIEAQAQAPAPRKQPVPSGRAADVMIDILRMGYDSRRAQLNDQMGKVGYRQAVEDFLADLHDRRDSLLQKIKVSEGENPVHSAEMKIIDADTAMAEERRNFAYGRSARTTPTEERILKMVRSGLVLTDNLVQPQPAPVKAAAYVSPDNGDYPVLTEIVAPPKAPARTAARPNPVPEGFPATIDEVVIVTPPASWTEEDHRAFDTPAAATKNGRHDRWSVKSLREERDEITSELAKAKTVNERLLVLTELVNPLHQNVVTALQKKIAGKSIESLSAEEKTTADHMLDHAFFLHKTSTALKDELLAAPALVRQEIRKTQAQPTAQAEPEGFFKRLKALGQSAADLAKGVVETIAHNARRLTVGALATGATAAAIFAVTPMGQTTPEPAAAPVTISNTVAFNNAAQSPAGFVTVAARVENAATSPAPAVTAVPAVATAEESPIRPIAPPATKTTTLHLRHESRSPAVIAGGFNAEASGPDETAGETTQEQTFDIATARTDLATLDRACSQIRANYDVDESHICAGFALK